MYAFGVEDAEKLSVVMGGIKYPEWVIRRSVQDFIGRTHFPGRLIDLHKLVDSPMQTTSAYFGGPGDRRVIQNLEIMGVDYGGLPFQGSQLGDDIMVERMGVKVVAASANAWGVPLRRDNFMLDAVAWTDGRFDVEISLQDEQLGSAFAACVAALVDFYVLKTQDRQRISEAVGVECVTDKPGHPSYWESCGPEYIGAFATRWSGWPPLRKPQKRSEALIHEIVALNPIPDPPHNFITGV